jgi:hypothetical protein
VGAIASIITNMRVSVISITMTDTQAYGKNVKSAEIWLGKIILRLTFMIPTICQDINFVLVMGPKVEQKNRAKNCLKNTELEYIS